MVEKLLVALIVAVAAFFMVRKLMRSLRGNGCSCDYCAHCECGCHQRLGEEEEFSSDVGESNKMK